MARELMADGEFVEVFVDTPFEECARRDPKGLYARALNGEIKNFTGVSDPYEPPHKAEITVNSEKESVEESFQKIIHYLEKHNLIPREKVSTHA
jgi:bifunctional enzyme CysN/CysC